MLIIICRERKWNDIIFFEYLFEFDSHKKCLTLAKWHSRFDQRILKDIKININNQNFQTIRCVTVDSHPFEMEEYTNYKIENSQGIWLVANDISKKGENKFENVEGKRCFFSIEIFEDHAQLLETFFLHEKVDIKFPMVTYHGTDAKNAESIEKEGLKESWGMLGKAVYVGSFWKSCRFACFNKLYHAQPGKVFRVFAFAKVIEHFPNETWQCLCSPECKKSSSDHLGIWQIMNDGAHVNVGNIKGDLKNEEWAFKERFIYVTSFAEIQPYEYSPFKRNILIK